MTTQPTIFTKNSPNKGGEVSLAPRRMMGLLTLLTDTTPSIGLCHSYVAKPGPSPPGRTIDLQRAGRIPARAAIHGIIADRLGRRGTRLGDCGTTSLRCSPRRRRILSVVLRPARPDRHRPRRAAAFGNHVQQRTGAATRCEHVRAVGRSPRLGAWGDARRCRGRVCDAGVRLDVVVLDRVAVVPAASLHALHVAGITEISALQGRTGEIRDMLSKLRPERAGVYKSADFPLGQAETPVNSVAVLLQAKYRRTTFAIWASAFLSLFCIFGLSGWIPTVMMQRGETFAASFGFGALMQIMSFVGALGSGISSTSPAAAAGLSRPGGRSRPRRALARGAE